MLVNILNKYFARQAIFGTLYNIAKSSGKQDHYDLRGYGIPARQMSAKTQK